MRVAAPLHATGAVEFVALEDVLPDETFRVRPDGDVSVLATSLGRLGQFVPVELRPWPGAEADRPRWQVVAGFRRMAAVRLLARERVLARLHVELSDDDAWGLALADALLQQPLSGAELRALRERLRATGVAPWAEELVEEALVRAPVEEELRERFYDFLTQAGAAAAGTEGETEAACAAPVTAPAIVPVPEDAPAPAPESVPAPESLPASESVPAPESLPVSVSVPVSATASPPPTATVPVTPTGSGTGTGTGSGFGPGNGDGDGDGNRRDGTGTAVPAPSAQSVADAGEPPASPTWDWGSAPERPTATTSATQPPTSTSTENGTSTPIVTQTATEPLGAALAPAASPEVEQAAIELTCDELARDVATRFSQLDQDLALLYENWADVPAEERRALVEQARYVAELLPFMEKGT